MSLHYLPMDTETGGLDPKKTDVLTIYIGVMDENFKLVDELDLKLKPNDRLPICEASALKVNGINLQEHLADPSTITYSEANLKILAMLKKYLKKTGRYSNLIPIGHNLPFDLNFIHEHLCGQEDWEKIVHYRTIDTNPIVGFLKDAGWFPRELGNLGSVVDYLKVPKRNTHNAREDSLMTVDVYKAILDLMKSKKDGGSTQDLISLLEAE
jgi:DNA polymerase III alpha subunit (gram-positive type)